jgi:hypothetical protein
VYRFLLGEISVQSNLGWVLIYVVVVVVVVKAQVQTSKAADGPADAHDQATRRRYGVIRELQFPSGKAFSLKCEMLLSMSKRSEYL